MDLKAVIRERKLLQSDIAKALGVSEPTVSRWVHGLIPAERVAGLAEVTGLPKHALRPDLFDAPQPQGAA